MMKGCRGLSLRHVRFGKMCSLAMLEYMARFHFSTSPFFSFLLIFFLDLYCIQVPEAWSKNG